MSEARRNSDEAQLCPALLHPGVGIGDTVPCDGVRGHKAVMHWRTDTDTAAVTRWRTPAEADMSLDRDQAPLY